MTWYNVAWSVLKFGMRQTILGIKMSILNIVGRKQSEY
jgi:hypothetical protein